MLSTILGVKSFNSEDCMPAAVHVRKRMMFVCSLEERSAVLTFCTYEKLVYMRRDSSTIFSSISFFFFSLRFRSKLPQKDNSWQLLGQQKNLPQREMSASFSFLFGCFICAYELQGYVCWKCGISEHTFTIIRSIASLPLV
ncbi:hypothetical protein CDAR_439081 [Caerostris darwini]|uniref:Uncharacterized protein n=1 Tax=Caerostris darwini TaxID=1538125 RepID=A0AAV4MJ12_9ARAC|nr:hypothetical protein CDAR_439081 [Caerostris darwini]